jgi:hypothetical protein
VTALRGRQGAGATPVWNADGEAGRISATERALGAFSKEEQRLLDVRDSLENSDSQDATRLLVIGSALAAALVLAANFVVGREMARRRRVEAEREKLIAELQRLLDEVKSLSGMIPICGWCKSVRTDEGYWQSVEQYVHDNTEATFTRGICPKCSEKFKAEILAAGSAKPT